MKQSKQTKKIKAQYNALMKKYQQELKRAERN